MPPGDAQPAKESRGSVPSLSFREVMSEEGPAGAEYRSNWRSSPERRRLVSAVVCAVILIAVSTAGAALLGSAIQPNNEYEPTDYSLISGSIVLGLGIYLGLFGFLLYRRQQQRAWFDRVVVLQSRRSLEKAEQAVADADDMRLSSLWTANQIRLEYYHRIATSQSEKSFTYGVAAAGVGLLMLLIAIGLAALAGDLAGAAAAGVIGVAGSAMSAYLGATFMKLQETASNQLRAYFSQPLEFSRYLAAERLLGSLDANNKEAATLDLIRSIAGNHREPGEAPDTSR
jgi:hypothetical protein